MKRMKRRWDNRTVSESWQQQQAESKRRRLEQQEQVSRLVQDIHDLIDGRPLEVVIAALEVVLQAMYRLRKE